MHSLKKYLNKDILAVRIEIKQARPISPQDHRMHIKEKRAEFIDTSTRLMRKIRREKLSLLI